MKTLRNRQKILGLVFLIFFIPFLLTNCSKTLLSSTTISTEIVPGSEIKTGNNNYSYEISKNPTIEDPTIQLKFSKSEQYIVQSKMKSENVYQYNIGKKPLLWMWFTGIAGAGLGYAIDAISVNSNGIIGPSLGYLVGLLIPILSIKPMKKIIFTNKQEIKYFPSSPLKLFSISVNNSDKSLKFITDSTGYLRFNLLSDYNLIGSPNNNPFIFNLNLNNISYKLNSLELRPTQWMNQYAKINIPDSKIRCDLNPDSKVLGIARKNMEYKVLANQKSQYKIELNNKTGWISQNDAETYYSVPKKQDISVAIKTYVEEQMNIWQIQGEFESTDDYVKRLNTRDAKLKEITMQAMNNFQLDYANLIDWNKSQISRYDPNSQTFKVNIPGLNEIIVTVPLINAQQFKENWNNISFKNQKFILVDGDWELSSLDLENDVISYTANYDSKIVNNYDPTNQFAFDLKPISIKPPSQSNEDISNIDVIDNYSINTNLPNTKASNPDAIAVVIGNSNYSYADPVNFAINDAQLMKVYLTNVLGYKPGNIIFIKNATKGEFDGTFGTNENYKGRLFDYIKPGSSDIFIYYSGHGAPGINDNKGYFVPVDCDPLRVELQGYSLDLFYKNLAQIPAKSITIVLDACFSGAGVLKNISSIRIKPRDIVQQINNSIITTSSDADEVSSWYVVKQHGLFTYFFLKAIHDYKNSNKNNDGNLTFQEIYNYVSDNSAGVPYFARRLNKVEQHPTLQGTDKEKIFVVYK